ncbi:hypothetical protein [Leisingera daeponensis]|uniref:hypothetical protein n=1 Tax=Leisingera daeponensis TaxID=405746 RepID=UPI001C97301E|nr:hypothetical protein [Leisingera daeponensis]MBY6059417.1 hypothetical protein [Leisingera daeponensis]
MQSFHGLSLEATERMVRTQLSWVRFVVSGSPYGAGCELALIKADTLDALFNELDRATN